MDPVNVEPMIEELEENVDDLEVALSKLLSGTLSDIANKIPVLDRAQLYVTTAWSIESILFCVHFSISTPLRTNNDSVSEAEWHKCQRTPSLP